MKGLGKLQRSKTENRSFIYVSHRLPQVVRYFNAFTISRKKTAHLSDLFDFQDIKAILSLVISPFITPIFVSFLQPLCNSARIVL